MNAVTPARRRGRKPVVLAADPADLADHYDRSFEALPAEGALYKAALHLRYCALCEERRLLREADYPDQMESDAHDSRAHHAALRYRPEGRVIGTLRLIVPQPGAILPAFTVCAELAYNVERTHTGELSRFIIARDFCRRGNDGDYGAAGAGMADRRRRIPHISLGLMQQGLRAARRSELTHVVALAEPALLRLLAGLGLHFAPVGDLVPLLGLRQPCYAKIDNLLRRLKLERPDVWYYVTDKGALA